MSRVATISAQLVLDSKRFDRTIRNVKKQFKKLATDTRAQAAAAGAVLGGIAVGLGSLSGELDDAGQKVVKLKKDLSSSFDGSELDKLTDQIRTLGATPPFSEQQFTQAAKSLAKFEREVSGNLVRIGNIAVGTGESFVTAQKAFAGFGKDSRATAQIEKILGIDSTELVKFGAVLDSTGQSLDFAGDNASKAQSALEQFADAKYGGAMDSVVTSSEQLRGEFDLLKQDLGIGLAEIGQSVAGSILPLAKGLRELSPETKKIVGVGVALTGFAAAAGAAAIAVSLIGLQVAASVTAAGGFTVVLGSITAALGTAATAAGGFLAALAPFVATAGAVVVALGSVAYAVYEVDKALKESVKVGEDALAIELKRAAGQRGLNDLLGKTSKELREQGKTAAEATNGILALHQRIELAREAGNDALVERLKEQVSELQQARNELAKLEKIDRDIKSAQDEEDAKTPEERVAEAEALAKARSEANKEALDQELYAIDLRHAKEEITQAESLKLRAAALAQFEADESTRRALLLETARFETNERKKAESDSQTEVDKLRRGRLQTALDFIESEKAANRLSAEEEEKALRRILDTYDLTEREKQSLMRQTAQVHKSILDQQAADAKKASDQRKADQQKVDDEIQAQAKSDQAELVRLQDRAKSQEVSAVDSEIESLSSEEGVDNTSKIQSALRERLKLQLEILRVEADRAKAATTNADVRSQIEQNLQRDIREKIRKTAKDEQSVLKQQLEARKKLAEDTAGIGSSFGDVYDISELGARLEQEQQTTRRPTSQPELSVPDLEVIEERLKVDVSKVTAEAPALETAIGNLSASIASLPSVSAVASIPSSQATPGSISGSSRVSQPSSFSGTLDLRVTVDSSGKPTLETVATTGLDGRYSEITRNARGMRGSITVA